MFKSRPAISIFENVMEACADDEKKEGEETELDPFVVKTIQDTLANIFF